MFLISNGGFAKNHSLSNDTVKFKSEFKLLFTPTVFQGFKISSFGDEKLLKSNFAAAWDYGLEYGIFTSNRLSITIGAHWGNIPDHFKFDVRPTDFYEVANRNIVDNNRAIVSQYIYFPIYASYTLNKKFKKIKISSGFAVNELYSFESSYTSEYVLDTGTTSNSKILFTGIYTSTTEFFVSGIVKVGSRKYFKDRNMFFDYGIKLNWAAKPVGEGVYAFYNLPNNDYGNLAFRFNYIGFELAFGIGQHWL
jgi:hypothetical protein